MKKMTILLLLLLIGVFAFGQEKTETYLLREVGHEAFNELVESLLEIALNDYPYCVYRISAPYDGDSEHKRWSTGIYISYYDDGGKTILFFNDQTFETIGLSNSFNRTSHGQDYIWIDYGRNRAGMQQLKRLINLEQLKAVAVISKEILANYKGGYPFFLKGDKIK